MGHIGELFGCKSPASRSARSNASAGVYSGMSDPSTIRWSKRPITHRISASRELPAYRSNVNERSSVEHRVQPHDLRDIEQRRAATMQEDDRRTGTLVSDTIDDVGRVGRCLRLLAEQRIQKHGHAMTRRGSNRLQALRAHRVVTVEPWMELDASKAVLRQSGDLVAPWRPRWCTETGPRRRSARDADSMRSRIPG